MSAPWSAHDASAKQRMMSWSQQQALVGYHGMPGVADYTNGAAGSSSKGGQIKHNMLASSVQGGIFHEEPLAVAPEQAQVAQFRRAMPSGGGDFLDRLAHAEARDGAINQYAAAGIGAGERPEYHKQMTPQQKMEAATRRATATQRAAQSVADNEAEKQRSFQMNAIQQHYGGHVKSAGRSPGGYHAEPAAGASAKNIRTIQHEQAQMQEQQARLEQAEHARIQRERMEQTEYQNRMNDEIAYRQHMKKAAEKKRANAVAHRQREEAKDRQHQYEQATMDARREQAWREQHERAQERHAMEMRMQQQQGHSQMQQQRQPSPQQMVPRARAASPRRAQSPRRGASPRRLAQPNDVAAGGGRRVASPGINARRTSIGGVNRPPGGHTSITLG